MPADLAADIVEEAYKEAEELENAGETSPDEAANELLEEAIEMSENLPPTLAEEVIQDAVE